MIPDIENIQILVNNQDKFHYTQNDTNVISIADKDSIALQITTSKEYHQLVLKMADSKEIIPTSDFIHHNLSPKKLRKLIKNTKYMGVIGCHIINFDNDEILYSFHMEITSSKMDRPELIMMIDTILNSTYSANIIDENSIVQFEMRHINDKIPVWNNFKDLKQFLQDVDKLFGNKSLKLHLTKREHEEMMTPASKFTHKTINHLLKHASKLQKTDVNSTNTIAIDDQIYVVHKIISDKTIRTYQTYENSSILSFIYKILKDINQSIHIIQQLLNAKPKEKINITDLFNGRILPKYMLILKEFHTHIKSLLKVIIKKYPLLKPTNKRLKITPIFQGDKTYQRLFKYMSSYKKHKNMQAKEEVISFPINSLDNLFEYYCLCCILEGFSHAGYEITTVQKDTFLIRNNIQSMKLYFCPYIYHKGENHKNIIDGLYILPHLKSRFKIPDYILEIHTKKGNVFWWLDAKYTQQLYNYKKLALIGYKYFHEISTDKAGHNKVIAGSILTPKQQKNSRSLSLYSFPNVFPILSSYALDISQSSEINIRDLINHIETIFHYC